MLKKSTNLPIGVALILAFFLISGCSKSSGNETQPIDTFTNKPALTGQLVYHNYSCYGCNDSKVLIYDFATGTNKVISGQWSIKNPMNAHFSPDGKQITFMGVTPQTDQWDVYIVNVSNLRTPVNLTASITNARNEDPKYSSDGKLIIFKSNGVLTTMDTQGGNITKHTVSQLEASMPYFIDHDRYVLYAAEQEKDISAIFSYSMADGATKPLYVIPGVYAYYPISISDSSFIFSRWYSPTDNHDQLYLGYLNGSPAVSLPFNNSSADYSDAAAVGDNYILLSSTQSGGKGGYDLFVADIISGKIWNLNEYNTEINSDRNELGASYHPIQ